MRLCSMRLFSSLHHSTRRLFKARKAVDITFSPKFTMSQRQYTHITRLHLRFTCIISLRLCTQLAVPDQDAERLVTQVTASVMTSMAAA